MAEGEPFVNAEPVDPGPEGLSVDIGRLERRMGPVLTNRNANAVFPTEEREVRLGEIIEEAKQMFLAFMDVTEAELVVEQRFKVIAERGILLRAIKEVLRVMDVNRAKVGLTSYRVALAAWDNEQNAAELWLSEQFHPGVRGKNDRATLTASPAKLQRDEDGELGDQTRGAIYYLPG